MTKNPKMTVDEVKELLLRLKSCREIALINDLGYLFITKFLF